MSRPPLMRNIQAYGTRPEQAAAVKAIHSEHASNTPKAFYKKRFSVAEVLASRIICKPLHLLACCVETDNGTPLVATSADRAPDCRHPRALIRAGAARPPTPPMAMPYHHGPHSPPPSHYPHHTHRP